MPASASAKKSKSRSNTPAKKTHQHHANDHQNANANLPPKTQQAFQDALEDVHTRYILNLPPDELATSDRIFFQLEQAWWYYEDIICDEMAEHETLPDPTVHIPASYAAAAQKIHLPRFKKLQPFCRKIFEISPLLNPLEDQFDALWAEFSRYRRKISTYGTILLNQDCSAVVLCKVYDGNSWTLPAGKVNQGEGGIEAGARETYEETGFDPNCILGKTKAMKEANGDLPWLDLKEEDAIRYTEGDGSGKLRTCFVCYGVPEDFPFAPVARKEVSAVAWHDIDELPKKSFAVIPFMRGLRKWIQKNGKQRTKTPGKKGNKRDKSSTKKRAGSKAKDRGSRHSTPGKNIINDVDNDLIKSGLGQVGEGDRWSEDDMFLVNEMLIGRKIEYDGNPQIFATKGFDGVDPHAFRVVGGSFMNSGKDTIAAAPDQDKLQPLYRSKDADNDDGLQPFFSDGGATPWGDVVSEALISEQSSDSDKKTVTKKHARSNTSSPALSSDESPQNGASISTNASGLAILSMLRGGMPNEDKGPRTIPAVENDNDNQRLDVFMTDTEITNNSQKKKVGVGSITNPEIMDVSMEENEHLLHLRQWIENLPETKPTSAFGDFRFDVDAIINAMKT